MGEQDADDALARSALVRIARGDEGALEELHSLYASAVFAFVSARLGDRGAAEEAAVDVWLGCWRSAAAFRGDSRVLTWLLGIAKRQACMRMRRIRPEELPLDEDLTQLADEAGDPSDALHGAGGNRRDHGRLGRASGRVGRDGAACLGCTSFRMRRSRR